MRVLNLSFNVIPAGQLQNYLQRHNQDRALLSGIATQHEVKFAHIIEQNQLLPPEQASDVFFHASLPVPGRLHLWVRRFSPDLIILHSFGYPLQVLVLQAIVGNKTKFIVQHHAEKPAPNRFRRILQKFAFSKADCYLFAARDLAQSFVSEGIISRPDRIHEVMEVTTQMKPLEKASTRQQLKLDEKMVFLWVGRLNKNKDPLTVLEALAQLTPNHRSRLYMFFSENEMEADVRTFIAKSGLTDSVMLMGKVPNEQLAQWYSAADYFISASHYEGSGTALCEAMACGCTPIVTNIPSFRYMTEEGSCAHLYEPGNQQGLAKILNAAITGTLNPLQRDPKEVFHERLSEKAISQRLVSIVDETLRG